MFFCLYLVASIFQTVMFKKQNPSSLENSALMLLCPCFMFKAFSQIQIPVFCTLLFHKIRWDTAKNGSFCVVYARIFSWAFNFVSVYCSMIFVQISKNQISNIGTGIAMV